MQRVRVGLTGLALVLVLIALASIILTSVSRESDLAASGQPNAAIVANITDPAANSVAERGRDEPLAELGVTPSTASTDAPSAASTPR
jgi:hypothetical protein